MRSRLPNRNAKAKGRRIRRHRHAAMLSDQRHHRILVGAESRDPAGINWPARPLIIPDLDEAKMRLAKLLALIGLIALPAIGQNPIGGLTTARVPYSAIPNAPVPVEKPATPPRVTGYIGIAHGKKGFGPVGSIEYRFTDTYGLYFARSTVAISGGVSFRFGHIR
jgi:hypothetical protein